MNQLEIKNITKVFDKKVILKDVSINLEKGEFLSILGASGCGKTTLLRIIMGLDRPSSGSIFKDGKEITKLEPGQRHMGMVFQNYALFPNMNVLENVAYALKFNPRKVDKAKAIAEDILAKLNMQDQLHKYPSQLSGGQQQRVAIARTLALEPSIILFDEPMAALDVEIRLSLRKELKRIQKDSGITMIYVTHDQEEACALSDKIMVLRDGVVQQIGSPKEVIFLPSNNYVQQFVVNNINQKINSLLPFKTC